MAYPINPGGLGLVVNILEPTPTIPRGWPGDGTIEPQVCAGGNADGHEYAGIALGRSVRLKNNSDAVVGHYLT